jgi:sulfur relay (sulfurtransferase) complex TusBCD TusD component (DsrE family)
MRHVLLVSRDLRWAVTLATSWAAAGDALTLVLLDEAAAAARTGHESSGLLTAALEAGVQVSVHDAAARRRGIDERSLTSGVKTVDLDEIADLVGDGADRVVWL